MADLTKAVSAVKVTVSPEGKKEDKHEDKKQRKPAVKRARDIKDDPRKCKGAKVVSDSTEKSVSKSSVVSTGAGSSDRVTDPPPLIDGPFRSDVSRIDKLENLIRTQNQQNQVFQEIIMNSLGMEYQDEGYNYPEDSDFPLTQADPSPVNCSDSEQVVQVPLEATLPVAPAVTPPRR